jgi:hypothetical protein
MTKGQFLRRLAGVAFVVVSIVVPTMIQVAPDEAEANFCRWFGASAHCLHGIPTWALWLASLVVGVIGLVWLWPWLRTWRLRTPFVRVARPESATSAQQPDWVPMWRVVRSVAAAIGDGNTKDCYPVARATIRQEASDSRLHVRGRKELQNRLSTEFSDLYVDIEPSYWKTAVLNALSTGPEAEADYHTMPEGAFAWGPKGSEEENHYAGLIVRRADVERIWPQAVVEATDGRHPDALLAIAIESKREADGRLRYVSSVAHGEKDAITWFGKIKTQRVNVQRLLEWDESGLTSKQIGIVHAIRSADENLRNVIDTHSENRADFTPMHIAKIYKRAVERLVGELDRLIESLS